MRSPDAATPMPHPHRAAPGTVKLTKHLVAFMQKHPRGYYWVRDASFDQPLYRDIEGFSDPAEFVAFFTGDLDQPVWLYPGDDLAAGRPYRRPHVVGPVAEPLTPKDRKTIHRLDEHLARMCAAAAPGAPLTRVHSFGRVSACPGTPGGVWAALTAAGFEVMRYHRTRRRGKPVDDGYLDVMGEEVARGMREIFSMM